MNTTWQTQPMRASRRQDASSAYAVTLGDPDSALADEYGVASDQRDRIEMWVNEGGAGDDVDQ